MVMNGQAATPTPPVSVTTRREVLDEWLRGALARLPGLGALAAASRARSLFHHPFASACCGLEYLALLGPGFDHDGAGTTWPRLSPRQADLLLVLGTVNYKLAPLLRQTYEAMPEPRWVMAIGACACSGGLYDNYAAVQGADRVVPVDVYVPGCPPHPRQILAGLARLRHQISRGGGGA